MPRPTAPAHPSDESELTRRLLEGDRSVLAPLLERHRSRLYHVIYRMVRQRDDAAELTQEAMLKVVQNAEKYNGGSQIGTWMVRIAMNLAISHLRKRKLRRAASLEEPAEDRPGEDAPLRLKDGLADQAEPSPPMRVETEEMLDLLHQTLDSLDPDLKAVLVLRDFEQMDYVQMADALALPLGTVKSRLFRARLALREAMFERCPQQQPAGEQSATTTHQTAPRDEAASSPSRSNGPTAPRPAAAAAASLAHAHTRDGRDGSDPAGTPDRNGRGSDAGGLNDPRGGTIGGPAALRARAAASSGFQTGGGARG